MVCRTSHPRATDCIQVPDTDTSWPKKYNRKFLTPRAAKVLAE